MEGAPTQGAKVENQIREEQQQRREWERRLSENTALKEDSQHEVLLPAGQLAPDSDGCALHILYFEGHISVKLLCLGQMDENRMLD